MTPFPFTEIKGSVTYWGFSDPSLLVSIGRRTGGVNRSTDVYSVGCKIYALS
jgi:hypothetical protein